MDAIEKINIYNEIVKCVELGRSLERLEIPLCILTSAIYASTQTIFDSCNKQLREE